MEIMDPMPAVLGVAAVLAAVVWWLRRKGALGFARPHLRRAPRRLQSIERLALSPNHALYLVRLDDRAILVAQSPSGLAIVDGAGSETGREAPALRAMAAEHAGDGFTGPRGQWRWESKRRRERRRTRRFPRQVSRSNPLATSGFPCRSFCC